ncbi:MAG TPA: SoxR reducing system RseC family protein [Prolixibacteraceae bacterium]|nr:SoxR reducing system RseC family protein [Prolixibacteraceae bacterium]
MDSKSEVTHNGIVNEISPSGIKVGIIVRSACGGCDIKSVCSMSEQKEKVLDIECNPRQFSLGQEVEVRLKTTQGFHALFLGYFLPFIVLLTCLLLTSALTKNELIIGLTSIASITVYYPLLFLFKNKIKKKFSYIVNPL